MVAIGIPQTEDEISLYDWVGEICDARDEAEVYSLSVSQSGSVTHGAHRPESVPSRHKHLNMGSSWRSYLLSFKRCRS